MAIQCYTSKRSFSQSNENTVMTVQ